MKTTILALAAATVLLVGCTSTKTASEVNEQAKPANSSGKVSVVYIPKSSGNPYFTQVQNGFEEAAKQFGYSFEVHAPATADPTSQLSIIKDEIQRGVNVICITPNSPDALNTAIDEARTKGIKILAVDADFTDNEDHRDAAVLPTDFANVGPSQLELLGSMIDYKGDFAILSATTDASNQNAWIAGIKESLKDTKYKDMNLVATVYGDDESQKSSTETEGLLTKFPNLRGIISPTSVGLAAAANVLSNAGVYPGGPKAKNGGLVLTGLSTPDQLRKSVEEGVVSKFQLWVPSDMGFAAGYLATQLASGKSFKPGDKLEVPGKTTMEVRDKGVMYVGPLTTFDKSNIDQYRF